jgi:pyruvate dehydrogenase E1 component
MGGAVWRKRLMDDLGDQGDVTALIDRRTDAELAALMENLGGNCVQTMAEAFAAIDHDRPTCFLAYTIKGWGTPIAGHKDNHGGLMTKAQMAEWQAHMGVPEGRNGSPSPGSPMLMACAPSSTGCPSSPGARGATRTIGCLPGDRGRHRPRDLHPGGLRQDPRRSGEGRQRAGRRIVTTSPDVTGTTSSRSLGEPAQAVRPHRARGRLHRASHPLDREMGVHAEGPAYRARHRRDEPVPAARRGGLSHSLFGKRLIPIGTVYDPFVHRGLDALELRLLQDARFIIVGTPSGVTLAPEGGAHQSIGTPLTGMAQDGLASFEPAFADELAVILEWAFDYLQRDGDGDPDERTWLRDETGGSVYLRLTTKPLEQPGRRADDAFRQGAIDGAYWLRPPGPNCEVVIAYQGAVADEAIAAAAGSGSRRASRCGRAGRDLGRPAERRLDRGSARTRARQSDGGEHVERLLGPLPRHCCLVTVIDGHPATLGWLGSVAGHRTISHGVEHFGQTGTIGDLYRHFRIDRDALVASVSGLTNGARFG